MISLMSELNRRDFAAALASFAALGTVFAEAAEAQGKVGPATGTDGMLSKSVVFQYDQLPVSQSANGGSSRAVLSGFLPTGEFVEVHETSLPAGQMPHPPHHHVHSEFILVREGQIEYVSDGAPKTLGPGGIIFNASNLRHGMKNIGSTMANYFVVAIGVQSTPIPG